MKSMTGYGKREAVWKGLNLGVEVRSVNHRFCEIVARFPKGLSGLEEELKQIVQRQCERGRIELTISMNGTTGRQKTLVLDRGVAKRYHDLLRDLQRDLHLQGQIDLGLVAGFRDVFSVTEPVVKEIEVKGVFKRLTTGALSDLDTMRCREGKALLSDIVGRLGEVRGRLKKIKGRSPEAVRDHFYRMQERVRKLLGDDPPAVDRLNQELAVYADRCDVTEELTRLDSHLAQFHTTIKEKKSMGRRLDFLLQEMGREVNTIGSKANDADIALHVVEIKSELEKIREQIQNVE